MGTTTERIVFIASDETGPAVQSVEKRAEGLQKTLEKHGDNSGSSFAAGFSKSVFRGMMQFQMTMMAFDLFTAIPKAMAQAADQTNVFNAKLLVTSKNAAEAHAILGELYQTSMLLGTSLETSITMMQRLSIVQKSLGASKRDLLELTKLTGMVGVIGGSTPDELKYGLTQFIQMLSYTKVQWQEFNSLIENTPFLADQIFKGFKKANGELGISMDQLKALVAAGKVTNTEIFDALMRRMPEINEMYAKIPLTFGRAFEKLHTAFMARMAEIEKYAGFAAWLSKTMGSVADAIDVKPKSRSLADDYIDATKQLKKFEEEYAKSKAGKSPSVYNKGPYEAGLAESIDHQQVKVAQLKQQIESFIATNVDLAEKVRNGITEITQKDSEKIDGFAKAQLKTMESLNIELAEIARLKKLTGMSDEQKIILSNYELRIRRSIKEEIEREAKLKDKMNERQEAVTKRMYVDDMKRTAEYIEKVNLINENIIKAGLPAADAAKLLEEAGQHLRDSVPEFQKLKSDIASLYKKERSPEQKRDDNLATIDQGVKLGEAQGGYSPETAENLRKSVHAKYLKDTNDITIKIENMWKSVGDTIGKSIGDGVADAIMQQKKMSEVLQSLLRDVLRQVISTLVQIGVQQATLFTTGEGFKATSTATSVASGKAIAAANTPAAATTSVATFGASAWAGMAALLAVVALMPRLMGVAHAGYPSIPEDGTYYLKKGEKVLNNADTKKIDKLMDGGGGGGISVNFTINAIDTQSALGIIMKNKPAIVGIVQEAYTRRGQRGPMG